MKGKSDVYVKSNRSAHFLLHKIGTGKLRERKKNLEQRVGGRTSQERFGAVRECRLPGTTICRSPLSGSS